MKGDFSRLTFDPKKNYGNVRMQQGRVQLDADWNEQVDITEHRIGTLFTDLIGLSGVPQGASTATPSDFQLRVEDDGIRLQPGHMYVAGMLVENAANVSLTAQPNLPAATSPTIDGRYLAYLDVWQRLVTALEDPEIRDPALGGADTTVRTKNVWQVKLIPIDDQDDVIGNTDAILDQRAPARLSTGKMAARLRLATNMLDNRLYRVEVHDAGTLGSATFKWSQDNGAIAASITQIHTTTVNDNQVTTIILSDTETAVQSRFAPNQWIEFSNEALTLNGLPGMFAKLTAVSERSLTIESWALLTAEQQAVCGQNWQQNLGSQPIVRRWDSPGEVMLEMPAENEGWLELEKGIEVTFAAGNYKTGDYWLIPTRHLTGQIDWPTADPQPPLGIQHHYAPLATLTLVGGTWTIEEDLRRLFAALTGGLLSKQGDIMTGSLRIGADLYVDDNVGIGTTAPQSDLEIGAFDQRDRYLTLKVAGGNQYRSGVKLWAWKENFGYSLEYDERHTIANGLHIKRHDQNADGSTLMFFRGDGNVGIGTTDPGAKLEVSGNALISGTLTVDTDTLIVDSTNNRVGIGKTDPGEKLEVNGNALISEDVKAGGTIYAAGRPLAYENYEIYVRGSAFDSSEGNHTYLNIANKSMGMNTRIGLNTVILNPNGTYKNKNKDLHNVYNSRGQWDTWADWVNTNAADGDVVAVATYDALRNPRGDGSAATLLKQIGAVEAFRAADGGHRSPSALLFIKGRIGAMESSHPHGGPNAHIKTTYYNLLNFGRFVLPVGVITLWSGQINNIPAGWQLCDGTNGTPDLRGRFIVGYKSDDTAYNTVGNTGGADMVALTPGQMPRHNHPGTTDSDGTTHNFKQSKGTGGSHRAFAQAASGAANTSIDTRHAHEFTTGFAGSNQAHENRPPYYVLAYIMYTG